LIENICYYLPELVINVVFYYVLEVLFSEAFLIYPPDRKNLCFAARVFELFSAA
jgi:hypothetical protein